jgi:NAD(P)-dependent dehydrogenase (short-subunit alcohol dehydrogenase family)
MSSARTVVITGAAGGIGSAVVDRFLANGDFVVAADIAPEALEAWRQRWDSGAPGGRRAALHTVATDISSEESVTALAEAVQRDLGVVDVLVNNAGIFPMVPFEEMTVETWRHVIDTNLTGTFLMTRAFLPLLKKSARGRVVNIGSGSLMSGTPLQSAYVASKGGILGLTKVLARELGSYGISVNLLVPGLTVTPAAAKVMPDAVLAENRRARAFQRDEAPEDVVGAIFFLASDDAAFITGQTLNVDGGRHLV